MYKLLIADDEPIERETLKMMITKYFPDIQVIGEAGNGREAIAKARELAPDIVFMDIKMPGITGVEAAKVIKEENEPAKIVIITAYDYFEYAKESLKAGVDDFLLKPALKENIQVVLDRLKQQILQEKNQQHADDHLKNKLKDMAAFIEKELISAILLRLDETEIMGYFRLLDIQLKWAYGVIVAIDNQECLSGSVDWAKRKIYHATVYEQVVKELGTLNLRFISSMHNNQLYVLIFGDADQSEYERKNQALHLMNTVKTYTTLQLGEELNIGVGLAYNTVAKLTDSFLEAQLALGYAEPAQSIHYGDIDLKIRYQEYPFQDEKRFCEEIINGNFQKSQELKDKLLHWLVLNCSSIEEMHRKLFELIVMITRSVAIFEHIDLSLLDTMKYFEEIKSLHSIGEIEAYLNRLIVDWTGNIQQIRQGNLNSQITKAFIFIADNYTNDITLEDVAKAVCLSPSYFSKVFKLGTGENFIDYLTKHRMTVAENLLKNKNYSIKDVCYQVGYNDPNYFSKLFKKHFGVNPSEYKISN